MALTPQYLDGVSEDLQAIYSDLETSIMSDIARRLSKANYLTPTAEWQVYKMEAMGASQQYIAEQIAKTTKLSEKEVLRMFKEAGIKSSVQDTALQNELIKLGKLPTDTIPLTASSMFTQILNANLIRTNNSLKKLTGTIAIDASGKLNQYMDKCQLMVQSGAFTQDQAINQTVSKFAAAGVTAFDYASGVHTSIEAAVRRASVTGVNQATAEISFNNADALGTDLVEVTSHSDARPEHAEWQGKVYKRTGSTDKYRNLAEATGYGTGAGLCGWNCRHSFYAYVEGVSETLPKTKYDETTYKNEQTQRYNERQIREWKKRYATKNAAGVDATKENAKVAYWQAKQKEFVEENNLVRLPQREKVWDKSGVVKVNTTSITSKAKKAYSEGSTSEKIDKYIKGNKAGSKSETKVVQSTSQVEEKLWEIPENNNLNQSETRKYQSERIVKK
jgi:hypothetical protein